MKDPEYQIYSTLVDISGDTKRIADALERIANSQANESATMDFNRAESIRNIERKLLGSVAYWQVKVRDDPDTHYRACLAQARAELREFRKQYR